MNDLFPPEEAPAKDYLSDLVGEGKKFADVQALARGKAESDNFIETLKRQMDELRTDYLQLKSEVNNRDSIEDMLNRRQPDPPVPEPRRADPPPRVAPKEEIDAYFDQRMEARERKQLEQRNLSSTRDMLRERFGTEYQAKLRETMDSIGLDAEYVTSLARKSPSAFAKVMGLEQTTEPFQTPPRTTNLFPTQRAPQKRTMSYYEQLKRNNPTEYHSARTNVQMHKDAQEMGAAFFDSGPGPGEKGYNRYDGPNAISHYEL